jgi:hypothetical protein
MLANPWQQLDAVEVLLQKASGLLHDCSRLEITANGLIREKLVSKILKIKLTLSMMRRDLTIVSGLVNGKQLRKNNQRPG